MTTLQLYKPIFMLELLICFFIYAFKLKKRNHFALRFIIASIILIIISFFFPIIKYDAFYTSIMFLILFIISLFMMYFCYDEEIINIIFIGIASYTTRHLAFQFYSLGETFLSMLLYEKIGAELLSAQQFYGNVTLNSLVNTISIVISIFLYINIFIIIYLLTIVFFGKNLWKIEDLKIENKSLLFLSAFVLIAEIFLHAVLVYISEDYNILYTELMYCYNILSCLFIFYMQKSLINVKKLQKELTIVNHLLLQEKEQYEISKQNIELINMKCHDIRHQIRQGFSNNVSKEYLNEIEKLINIYDSTVKTGNKELDVILTEKSLLCAKNSIVFTCIVDGEKLSFMDKEDIYALFGNLIDNSIEAVSQIEDKEKRIIELNVKCIDNIIVLNINNYFVNQIKLNKDGLPLTTKEKNGYHGYGLKSIKYIVEKYKGDLSISVKNNVFNVDIILLVDKNKLESDYNLRNS